MEHNIILKTERLVIRRMITEDALQLFNIMKDKEISQMAAFKPLSVLDWIRGKEIGTNSLGEEVKVNELRDFNFEFNCHLNYTTLLSYSKDLVFHLCITEN